MVARIFHILQVFCCAITWHLQSSCPMHFSSAPCREVPWEAVRVSAMFTCGLWSPQTGNCLCSGHWLLLQHLSHLFYWSPCEKGFFFAVEIFSPHFLAQTAKTFPSHRFLMLVFPFQSVAVPMKMLLRFCSSCVQLKVLWCSTAAQLSTGGPRAAPKAPRDSESLFLWKAGLFLK